MRTTRAFVGHSFSSADKGVVLDVLKLLDVIADVRPEFSWVHAERPELKLVTEKVLTLAKGCNLFIGICTRREQVLASEVPLKLLGHLLVRKDALQWKTSDWVIQEIGLAIGMGMPVILLVEQGVRPPGRLQGDIEYLPFDRDQLASCLPGLLQMVCPAGSSEKGSGVVQVAPGTDVPEEDASVAQSTPDVPSHQWEVKDYELAYLRAVMFEGESGAPAISDQYLSSAIGNEGDNRITWLAFCEFIRIKYGKTGSLDALRTIAENNSRTPEVIKYLAKAYAGLQEHRKAALNYESAARLESDVERRLVYLGEAAKAFQEEGDVQKAASLINEMQVLVQGAGLGESRLLKTQLEVAESTKEPTVAIAALEKLVDDDPSDWDLRFTLAYKYSESGKNELAGYHYLRIPHEKRTEFAWNNLGIALAALGLPAKSIAAYRAAQSMGNTLAVSNLATKLGEAGLIPEAKEMCDAALLVPDHHHNVESTLAYLNGIPDAEDAREQEIVGKAKPVSDFYRIVGKALTNAQPTNRKSQWVGPDCRLEVSIQDGHFAAAGRYECKSLLRPLSRAGTPEEMIVEYSGKIVGRAIIGSVSRKYADDKSVATLLGGTNEEDIVGAISLDDSEIRIFEQTHFSKHKFYTLLPA